VHPVREALRAGRRRCLRLWIRTGELSPALKEIAAEAEARGVPYRIEPPEALRKRVAGSDNPQGVVLEAEPLPELDLPELLATRPAPRCLVALDGVEDPRNAGAITRVAEAAGAAGLVLSRRRAPPLGAAFAHASAGAAEWLPVARVANLARALDALREGGFWVVGGDPDAGEDLFDAANRVFEGDLVVVLGAEGRGLRPGVLDRVDHRLRIPMRGRVGSLNVASAAAILLYEWVRRSEPGPRRGLAATPA
jgi:23S rRNA (guanosine2251-2'-O)-methyltransferase